MISKEVYKVYNVPSLYLENVSDTIPFLDISVLEAEAEAVGFVSRFQIGGWDSY